MTTANIIDLGIELSVDRPSVERSTCDYRLPSQDCSTITSTLVDLPILRLTSQIVGSMTPPPQFKIANAKIERRFLSQLSFHFSSDDVYLEVNKEASTQVISSLENLTSLVQRFKQNITDHKHKMERIARHLTSRLVIAGNDEGIVNDPPFLTRPSNILRLKNDSIRLESSWKILVKLRHLLHSCNSRTVDTYNEPNSATLEQNVTKAREILTTWRSWEFGGDIDCCHFMNWFSSISKSDLDTNATPISILLSVSRLNLIYEMRTSSNDLVVNAFTSRMTQTRPAITNDAKNAAESLTSFYISAESMNGRLNSPVEEIVEEVHKHFQQEYFTNLAPSGDSSTIPRLPSASNRIETWIQIGHADVVAKFERQDISWQAKDCKVNLFSAPGSLLEGNLLRCLYSLERSALSIGRRKDVRPIFLAFYLQRCVFQLQLSSDSPLTLTCQASTFHLEGEHSLVETLEFFDYFVKDAIKVYDTVHVSLLPKKVSHKENFAKQSLAISSVFNVHRLSFKLPIFTNVVTSLRWDELKFSYVQAAEHRVIFWNTSMGHLAMDKTQSKSRFSLPSATLYAKLTMDVNKLDLRIRNYSIEIEELLQCIVMILNDENLDELKSLTALSLRSKNVENTAEAKSTWVVSIMPDTFVIIAKQSTNSILRLQWRKPNVQLRIRDSDVRYRVTGDNMGLHLLNASEPSSGTIDFQWTLTNITENLNFDLPSEEMQLSSNFVKSELNANSLPHLQAANHMFREFIGTLNTAIDTAKRLHTMNATSTSSDKTALRRSVSVSIRQIRVCYRPIVHSSQADTCFTVLCKEIYARYNISGDVLQLRLQGFAMELLKQIKTAPVSMDHPPTGKNVMEMPQLTFMLRRRLSKDKWAYSLQAWGDLFKVDFDSNLIPLSSSILESLSHTASEVRLTHINSAGTKPPSGSAVGFLTRRKVDSVRIAIEFRGAMIRAFQLESTVGDTNVVGHKAGEMILPGLNVHTAYQTKQKNQTYLYCAFSLLASNNRLSPDIMNVVRELMENISASLRSGHMSSSPKVDGGEISNTQYEGILSNLLGKCKLHLILDVAPQHFVLDCLPQAKISMFLTLQRLSLALISYETKTSTISLALNGFGEGFELLLKHHYSRESSLNFNLGKLRFNVDSNKRLQGDSERGFAAGMDLENLNILFNAKQGQDLLIFKCLWTENLEDILPVDRAPIGSTVRTFSVSNVRKESSTPPSLSLHAALRIRNFGIKMDLGQAIGCLDLRIPVMSVSTFKAMESQKSLFFSLPELTTSSVGRLSGALDLHDFKLQSNIFWPKSVDRPALTTPIVQLDFRWTSFFVALSYDYQMFFFVTTTLFRSCMHNKVGHDVDDVFVNVTSGVITGMATMAGPASVRSFYRSLLKLKREKEELRDIAIKPTRRGEPESSSIPAIIESRQPAHKKPRRRTNLNMDINFQKLYMLGFRRSFSDSPVLFLSVLDIGLHFYHHCKPHSLDNDLKLVLGRLELSISAIDSSIISTQNTLTREQSIKLVQSLKGGTILAIPKTAAFMKTSQASGSSIIRHEFVSDFGGRVDVGWNFGSVEFVRDMAKIYKLSIHAQGQPREIAKLANLNKDFSSESRTANANKQPPSTEPKLGNISLHSRYNYSEIRPAQIETPQLRAMGDATPPLEWIGVNRSRLPGFVHQAIIVPLQDVC